MKKMIAIIVAVLFALTVTSLSFAVEEKKATPAPAVKKAEPMKPAETLKVTYVTGKVKAVDTVAKTITVVEKVGVRGKEEETVVTIDEKTTITKGKAKKMLADVKVGNNVTVKYTEVEGKNVAQSVAIKAAKKKAAKKK